MRRSWHKSVTKVGNRIELGIEGEEWVSSLGALIIPIPGTNKHIIVTRGNGVPRNRDKMYLVNEDKDFVEYDDIVLLAAAVYDLLDQKKGF